MNEKVYKEIKNKSLIINKSWKFIKYLLTLAEFLPWYSRYAHPHYYFLRGYIFNKPVFERIYLPKLKKQSTLSTKTKEGGEIKC